MNLDALELKTALEAAQRAAEVCTAVYITQVQGAAKAGREPVTIADYASQAIINARLKAAFPDDGILGEEHADEFSKSLNESQRAQVVELVSGALGVALDEGGLIDLLNVPQGTSGRKWIIDPIDGTKGFLARRAYAIAIGLQDEMGLALGVLGCPNLALDDPGALSDDGVMFYAIRGAGAYAGSLNAPQDQAERLQVSDAEADGALILMTSFESAHSDKGLFNEVVAALPASEVQSIGMDGQGKYGLVAGGRATGYFRLVPQADYRERVWDHAAGTLIVQEAGGQVTDLHGQPLDYNQGAKLSANRGVLVSNGRIHGALLAALADIDWEG